MEVLISYRRRIRRHRGIVVGLELVMLDPTNPRSLLVQIERLQQHLAELPGADAMGSELEEEERALLEAMTSLRLSRLDKLLVSQSGQRDDMDNLLQQLADLLKEFNRFISDKHFDHRVDPQQLVTTFWGEQ